MVFVELPAFTEQELLDDEALRALQARLLLDPLAGDLIRGVKGLRKLRVALPGRGKRGGARVIYYWWASKDLCYLIYAYAKNTQESLTSTQTKILSNAMQEVIDDE